MAVSEVPRIRQLPIGVVATHTEPTTIYAEGLADAATACLQVVDHLITNFHLPKSTLMMLISAFAGHGHVMSLYRHAIEERYRFFSYGDSMLLSRSA